MNKEPEIQSIDDHQGNTDYTKEDNVGPYYFSGFQLNNVKHCQEIFDHEFCSNHFENDCANISSINEYQNGEISQIKERNIIIGMHPDQATEPIVDMALKYQKPFAVVPCCVFAHENPHRRLKSKPRYVKCLFAVS